MNIPQVKVGSEVQSWLYLLCNMTLVFWDKIFKKKGKKEIRKVGEGRGREGKISSPKNRAMVRSDVSYIRSLKLNSILCFNGATDTKQDWVMVKLTQHKKRSHYLMSMQLSFTPKNSTFQK